MDTGEDPVQADTTPSIPVIPARFPATRNLLFINFVVFALCKLLNFFDMRSVFNLGLEWGPATLGGEWWRMFTSMFLHAGWGHLLGNMWWLWVVGKRAELLFSKWVFVSLYLLTGLMGEVLSLTVHPEIFSCGASGAIFGITGVVIAAVWLGRLPSSLLPFSWRIWPLMIFTALSLFGGAGTPHVDNAAHLGGFVSGVLLGILLPSRRDIQEVKFSLFEQKTVLAMLSLLVLSAVTLRLYYRDILPLETAKLALDKNSFEDAAGISRSVIDKRPDDAVAYQFLGQAFMGEGDYQHAEASFNRAWELDPGNYSALRLSLEAHSKKK
jgi:membrane associated rhomboid family serine protease